MCDSDSSNFKASSPPYDPYPLPEDDPDYDSQVCFLGGQAEYYERWGWPKPPTATALVDRHSPSLRELAIIPLASIEVSLIYISLYFIFNCLHRINSR